LQSNRWMWKWGKRRVASSAQRHAKGPTDHEKSENNLRKFLSKFYELGSFVILLSEFVEIVCFDRAPNK
jgi:hypothetical protein